MPVIACLGADAEGGVYNINADMVGNQLAAALLVLGVIVRVGPLVQRRADDGAGAVEAVDVHRLPVMLHLHRVLPEEPADFSPNAILQVQPDFLDYCIERIRALGFPAPGSYREFSRLSSVHEAEGSPKAEEMIRQLPEEHRVWLGERLTVAFDVAVPGANRANRASPGT